MIAKELCSNISFFLNKTFSCTPTALKVLVPWPGVETLHPAMEAQHLNRWTAVAVPVFLNVRMPVKNPGQAFLGKSCVVLGRSVRLSVAQLGE